MPVEASDALTLPLKGGLVDVVFAAAVLPPTPACKSPPVLAFLLIVACNYCYCLSTSCCFYKKVGVAATDEFIAD